MLQTPSHVPATATRDDSSGKRVVARSLLGLGRTGVVYLEDNPDGNGKRVVKEPQHANDMEYRDHLLREIACYQKLDATAHPYVLSSLGNNGDLEAPALYLPYMENGDLMTYLELHGTKTTPAQRMKWAFQLTLAILYLHEQRIFHTDLRPPNILIDAELNLKVADFEGASFDGHGGTACVTPQYSTKQYGFYASLTDDKLREVDIFCLAGLLYVIQTGMEPFEAFEEDAQFLEAYGQQNFPDMSGVALGDLIEDIWRGDITNAKDILVRIVNDNNFLDLLC